MSNPNPPETTVVPQETRLIPLRLLRQDDANAVSWRGGRTGTGCERFARAITRFVGRAAIEGRETVRGETGTTRKRNVWSETRPSTAANAPARRHPRASKPRH